MFATTAPGLEPLLALELKRLGSNGVRAIPGGVAFLGDGTLLYSANLSLRTAGRVLLRLDHFRVRHLTALEKRAKGMAWDEWLNGQKPLCVRATRLKSKIYHSVAAAERVARGIAARLNLMALPSYKEGAPDEAGGA